MAERNKTDRNTGAGPTTGRNPSGEAAPPPRRRGWRPNVRAGWRPTLLAILSALLLTLAFPPIGLSWLAYVALAPLLVMAVRTPSARVAVVAAWLGGIVFFGINMWWIWPVTRAGAIALVPYLAAYWAVFAYAVRGINRTLPVPLTLLAPVAWVPLELLRAHLLTGMPWVYVGHTQYRNLPLIQIADFLGAYGNSFLCLMMTGLAADFLVRPMFRRPTAPAAGAPPARLHRRFSRVLAFMVLLAAGTWVGTVAYGLYRLTPERRPGPVVTSIQTCIPQSVKNIVKAEQMQTAAEIRKEIERVQKAEHEMLDQQLDLTARALQDAADQGLKPDLVVWPETMVPGIMNPEFLLYDPKVLVRYGFEQLQARSQGFWEEIRREARTAGAPILFGGHAAEPVLRSEREMDLANNQNAAFLVGPRTMLYRAEHVYAKCHLVPFGEYLPFRESWPWLHTFLRGFTPYDYDYSLRPGAHDQAPFILPCGGREVRFQVPICYEDAMPYRVREMVASADPLHPKAVDFLVNISNDGWFNGSVELEQHLALCVFRAVENRVPIVRAVNTGISALVQSDGRIDRIVQDADGRRRFITGFFTGRIELDDRVAPYTYAGDLFAHVCLGAALVLAAGAAGAGHLRRRGRHAA
jgi:apolipoprotein N-acyltransferase